VARSRIHVAGQTTKPLQARTRSRTHTHKNTQVFPCVLLGGAPVFAVELACCMPRLAKEKNTYISSHGWVARYSHIGGVGRQAMGGAR
jgi:hypothetical protein